MRILIAEGELERHGGQEVGLLELTRALAKRGHSIDLIYHGSGSLEPEYRAFCDSMRAVPGISPDRNQPLRTALGSASVVAAGLFVRPDVVYISQTFDAPHGATLSAIHQAPLVCHVGLPPLADWPLPLRIGLRRVDRFIAVSRSVERQYAAQTLGPGVIDVVHNGIDPAAYPPGDGSSQRRRLGLSDSTFVVLYAGRIDPPKGIDILIEAWRQLDLSPEEGSLVIAGDARGGLRAAESRRYADRLRSMMPADSGIWLPRQDDVVALYQTADVVVLPSVWEEPFGRVVIEAMSCSRPVVASAVGGIPDILDGPMRRFLVPPGDPAALAAKLASLRGWQRNEPGLGDAVRHHVQRHFSLDANVAGVERVLADAVAHNHTRLRRSSGRWPIRRATGGTPRTLAQ